jgi:ABC-2 type transport system ATP-binding protein
MSESALLDVGPVNVERGGRRLLHDVSFYARSREILGIIGPNGSGKTTLFEVVAGFIPESGRGEFTRSDLFYMPDGLRPWSAQRAGWCIDFIVRLFGGKRDDDAIEAFMLAPLLRQRVGSLSKGEVRRLTLAIALSTPHPLLLLDEPFDGLDFRQTRATAEVLRARAAAGRTFVLSIHQLSDAARVCDRFLLLDHGRVLAEGDMETLRKQAGKGDASLEEIFLALE